MKEQAAGYVLNTLLGLALLFSIIISYNGAVALARAGECLRSEIFIICGVSGVGKSTVGALLAESWA